MINCLTTGLVAALVALPNLDMEAALDRAAVEIVQPVKSYVARLVPKGPEAVYISGVVLDRWSTKHWGDESCCVEGNPLAVGENNYAVGLAVEMGIYFGAKMIEHTLAEAWGRELPEWVRWLVYGGLGAMRGHAGVHNVRLELRWISNGRAW